MKTGLPAEVIIRFAPAGTPVPTNATEPLDDAFVYGGRVSGPDLIGPNGIEGTLPFAITYTAAGDEQLVVGSLYAVVFECGEQASSIARGVLAHVRVSATDDRTASLSPLTRAHWYRASVGHSQMVYA